MLRQAIAFAILCAIGVVAPRAARSRQEPPASAATAILDAARKLAIGPRLSRDVVQKTFDVTLAIDPESSHRMVTFFAGKPRPGSRFAQVLVLVDLRVPTSLNRVMKEPFLNVELRDDAGIGADDLEAQLGRPTEIDVPEPNPRYAVTYVYALRPSLVRFSIGLEPARRVVGFSIDRPGDSR